MCGRFVQALLPAELRALFDLVLEPPQLSRKFNIAPGHEALIIRRTEAGRAPFVARWGLKVQGRGRAAASSSIAPINARSETIFERSSFRSAARMRRCLVPATGFYEWKKIGRRRQPYLITTTGRVWAMAGLWTEPTNAPPMKDITFAILTMSANPAVATLHDRMPVILEPKAFDTWLDPQIREREAIEALIAELPAEATVMTKVSMAVNSVRHDDPSLVEPELEGESDEEASRPGARGQKKEQLGFDF